MEEKKLLPKKELQNWLLWFLLTCPGNIETWFEANVPINRGVFCWHDELSCNAIWESTRINIAGWNSTQLIVEIILKVSIYWQYQNSMCLHFSSCAFMSFTSFLLSSVHCDVLPNQRDLWSKKCGKLLMPGSPWLFRMQSRMPKDWGVLCEERI